MCGFACVHLQIHSMISHSIDVLAVEPYRLGLYFWGAYG